MLFLLVIIVFSSASFAQTRTWFWKGKHACIARTTKDKPLFDAVKNGNESLAKNLLQKGGNPNITDDCGIPIVTYATHMIRPDLLRILIESGANVNTIDNSDFEKKPPLLWLIDVFDTQLLSSPNENTDRIYESVKLLLENGADVNLRGTSQDSALIYAVKIRQSRLVEMLIAAGAKINFQNDEDRTAYSYAAQLGDKELKKILIKAGADVTIGVKEYRKECGENAFFQAAADGRTDVVEAILASGIDVNSANEEGKMTALMRAFEESTVDSLLAAGANVNLKDNSGHSALMWAVLFRNKKVVEKLIAAGADVNAKNNKGESVLELASNSDIEKMLIKAGAKKPFKLE